jgi:sulfide dehydrogenase cytochrome subunit
MPDTPPRFIALLPSLGRSLPILAAALALSAPVPAADPETPDVVGKCFKCHGREGVDSEDGEPVLAGQPAAYIVQSLQAFRSGERPSKEMKRVAEGLSEADMETAARYFSGLASKPSPRPFEPALAEKGARLHARLCEKCHVDGGRGFRMKGGTGPILAGQTVEYLRSQFGHFMGMDREMPREMGMAILELRPGDSLALAHYYASLAGRQ